jgi:hypothetical protein
LALHMVMLGLCVAARAWKPRQTFLVLTSLPEAVWNSVGSVATEDSRFLRPTHFSTRQFRSVSLCGLPLCSWDVVAPRHLDFTITALTVDRPALARQKFDELTCWKGGILWRCHVESHWALQYGPFYCQCLSLEIALLCTQFYTPVSNGVAEIAKSTNLKRCPHTFVYIV